MIGLHEARFVSSGVQPSLISTDLWCQIIRSLGEFEIWEGNISRAPVKLARITSEGQAPHVRYMVRINRAWVSEVKPTATEALSEISKLIGA